MQVCATALTGRLRVVDEKLYDLLGVVGKQFRRSLRELLFLTLTELDMIPALMFQAKTKSRVDVRRSRDVAIHIQTR